MTNPQATTMGHAKASARTVRHDLETLAQLDCVRLEALYRAGTAPDHVGVLNGHPKGRMLAIRGLDGGPPSSWLRAFSGARAFPWGGKSFSATGSTSGRGINRVHLFGRHQLFPFHTSVRDSVIDERPCVVLDYDLPDNPGLIRAIHDEVREIEPGLFLGPAMWKGEGRPALVLWFALDTRVQARAIGEGPHPLAH